METAELSIYIHPPALWVNGIMCSVHGPLDYPTGPVPT